MTREEAKQLYNDEVLGLKHTIIDKIYDDFDRQLLKKDCEIAKYQGMLKAMKSEVQRLHPIDCSCITCKGKR